MVPARLTFLLVMGDCFALWLTDDKAVSSRRAAKMTSRAGGACRRRRRLRLWSRSGRDDVVRRDVGVEEECGL